MGTRAGKEQWESPPPAPQAVVTMISDGPALPTKERGHPNRPGDTGAPNGTSDP